MLAISKTAAQRLQRLAGVLVVDAVYAEERRRLGPLVSRLLMVLF
jgi:hypothetical protein